ncbi:uncharacterized protein J8A68_002655 [[Candida] subhashii]|uniref:ER membrane protein complex subunit 10 n=1 Tax=[Candida] subhashii TaxID=561895 RepID=A0A8J5QNT3_9ASCO|nr:uncharacterized protein J8A68_002655 [[Candida] subhashii]KAG7663795.1 hypothetical protein J8A68_002655 [[Candida] subhashii]
MVLDPQLGYCFGTNDLPNHECFSYTKGIKSLKSVQFHVFLDQASQIQHISVNYDSETNDNDGPQVIIHPFELAPSPNLNPESLKGKQKKESSAGQQRVEKVIQKKIIKVKDENGNEIEKEIEQEVEVEVDDRSWIQKNWMYIVPPLILFLMFSKDEPKK